jgi:hypothetical protein
MNIATKRTGLNVICQGDELSRMLAYYHHRAVYSHGRERTRYAKPWHTGIHDVASVFVVIDPAIFNLKYWMVPPYRDDGNHRYEKTDTGSPV